MGRSRIHAAERRLAADRDPAAEAAQEAGLVYTTDDEPGIRRVRQGKRFEYLGPDGRRVRDSAILDRIRSLAIPPAWDHVWISTRPRGHLQATGRDARGRKQHRYHARWREVRDADKFERMTAFGRVLPKIRARVALDLRRPGLPKEKVVATIVRLLETTYARVGNEEYARENKSFGLTTLRSRHVDVKGSTVRFLFKGKSGREVSAGVTDRRVARVIKSCEELPGQHLFQYVDPDGGRGTVTSDDVNEYLRSVSGQDFTAKDFRTWAATVLAACALRDAPPVDSETAARRAVLAAIDAVAHKLGHTRAVCRRSYVHPAVIDTYVSGGYGSIGSRSSEGFVRALLRRTPKRKVSKELPRLYQYARGENTHAA
ncbi:MAG TPA: DNA topoisomerase IB [Candidatus Dormibacteraeota bacterium]|nr:DNA topoisomerase IB [Candidatus Dormibacteraeota bacterium]